MRYTYLTGGGRYQDRWNAMRDTMMDKKRTTSAKQKAMEIMWSMLERKIVFRSVGLLRDGELVQEWLNNFAFLKAYGLPRLPSVYKGIMNDEHHSTWLKSTAMTIDRLLSLDDSREIEYMGKKHSTFKLTKASLKEVNQETIF